MRERGITCFHFYTLNLEKSAIKIVTKMGLYKPGAHARNDAHCAAPDAHEHTRTRAREHVLAPARQHSATACGPWLTPPRRILALLRAHFATHRRHFSLPPRTRTRTRPRALIAHAAGEARRATPPRHATQSAPPPLPSPKRPRMTAALPPCRRGERA